MPSPTVNESTTLGANPPNKVFPVEPAVISSFPSAPKNLSIWLFAMPKTPSNSERFKISWSLIEVMVPLDGLPSKNKKSFEFRLP